ncbi:MAG: hypothetical protein ABL927_09950 [Bdellovibrionales bacterium]
MDNIKQGFHNPLNEGDTQEKTVGCRHNNPNICSKYWRSDVCAFGRKDGICVAPPASWKKQYLKLADQKRISNDEK